MAPFNKNTINVQLKYTKAPYTIISLYGKKGRV